MEPSAIQETAIRIDDSSEAYAERLELCVLRSAAFDAGRPELPGSAFFAEAFRLLENRRTGSGEQLSAENVPEEGPTAEETESGRLFSFWLEELRGIPALQEGGCVQDLVIAWETTLQLLFEAESALAEERPVNGKELRDILYACQYDYAEEFLQRDFRGSREGRAVPRRFVTELAAAFLSGNGDTLSPHAQEGIRLFFGSRLKARLLEAVEKSGEKAAAADTGKVPEIRGLAAHQKKTLAEFFAKAVLFMLLAVLPVSAAGCGKKNEEEETPAAETEAVYDYPGTVYYENEDRTVTDRFGVMHATVLDVQDGEKEGLYVYTLRDEQDPDNAWCLYSQDVGSIVAEMNGGKKVAVLFSGDIVNDPDSVEFIAILDEAPYSIKKAEGTTVANMMNSFSVRTDKGVELNFIKDNCKVDRDALSTDRDSRVLIYYADCGVEKYPVRVYKSADKRPR